MSRAAGVPLLLRAGTSLIAADAIVRVDGAALGASGVLWVHDRDGQCYRLDGADAIEAVLLLKPSLTEGLRLKWQKRAWAVHNLIGHPGMQLLAWIGLPKLGLALHEATIPRGSEK